MLSESNPNEIKRSRISSHWELAQGISAYTGTPNRFLSIEKLTPIFTSADTSRWALTTFHLPVPSRSIATIGYTTISKTTCSRSTWPKRRWRIKWTCCALPICIGPAAGLWISRRTVTPMVLPHALARQPTDGKTFSADLNVFKSSRVSIRSRVCHYCRVGQLRQEKLGVLWQGRPATTTH